MSYAAQNSQAGNPELVATPTFGSLHQPPSAGSVVSSAEGGLSPRVQQQSSVAGVASTVDVGSRSGCSIQLLRRRLLTLLKVATTRQRGDEKMEVDLRSSSPIIGNKPRNRNRSSSIETLRTPRVIEGDKSLLFKKT